MSNAGSGEAVQRLAVSGLLPVRDGMSFMPVAIENILGSLRIGDELLVIDDCSTDGTYEYTLGLSAIDSRLKVIRNPHSGLASALNCGLRHAVNDWVVRYDVDDLYHPERIHFQEEFMVPNVGVIFSDYQFRTASGSFLGVIPTPIFPIPTAISLVSGVRTPHPSAVINKFAALSVGGYLAETFPAEDAALWLRILDAGFELRTIPKVLLFYTLNSGSVSSRMKKEMAERVSELRSKGFLDKEFQQALAQARINLNSYNKYPYSAQRQFLHLQDLLKYWGHYTDKKLIEILRILFACRNINILLIAASALNLFRFKILRDFERRRIARSNLKRDISQTH